MNRIKSLSALTLIAIFGLFSCQQGSEVIPQDEISQDVLDQLQAAGFDVTNQAPIQFQEGYLVEGDIYIPSTDLETLADPSQLADVEQYSTNNLVSTGGARTISVYMEVEGATDGGGGGGNGGPPPGKGKNKTKIDAAAFPSTYDLALDDALARFNSENLEISFVRASSSAGADIVVSRLNKRDERRGVLGSAGFPTSSGDPYGTINMSGVLETSYGLPVSGIATIIAHEMGHCIGFRHTDYFDRSISCGGSTANEGDGGVGANHIPGTTTGADLQGNGSWMLACTDGSDRQFTNDDKTALDYLY